MKRENRPDPVALPLDTLGAPPPRGPPAGPRILERTTVPPPLDSPALALAATYRHNVLAWLPGSAGPKRPRVFRRKSPLASCQAAASVSPPFLLTDAAGSAG